MKTCTVAQCPLAPKPWAQPKLRALGFEFQVYGLGFSVEGLGFRVFGFRV